MKVKIVSSGDIERCERILEATPYVDPTRAVDVALVRTQRTIDLGLDRLERLKVEKAAILVNPARGVSSRIRRVCTPPKGGEA